MFVARRAEGGKTGGVGKRVFEEEGQARSNNLGIGSPGDEVGRPGERPRLWGVRDAFVGP